MNYRTFDYMNRWTLRLKHKHKPMPKWIAFVVSLGCLICKAPCQFSHTVPKAARGACSDVLGHGICGEHHEFGATSIHVLGSIEEFQRVHKIDFNEALLMYWTMFLQQHGRDIEKELGWCKTKQEVIEKMESLIKELA